MSYKIEYVRLVNNQISLPVEMLENAHLHDGDYFEVNIDDRNITLIPLSVHEFGGESWLDEPEWQERMTEAEEDVKAGRLVGPFDSAKELLRSLKSK